MLGEREQAQVRQGGILPVESSGTTGQLYAKSVSVHVTNRVLCVFFQGLCTLPLSAWLLPVAVILHQGNTRFRNHERTFPTQPYPLEMVRVMEPAQQLDTVPAMALLLSLLSGFCSLCVSFLGTFCIHTYFMSFPEKNFV